MDGSTWEVAREAVRSGDAGYNKHASHSSGSTFRADDIHELDATFSKTKAKSKAMSWAA